MILLLAVLALVQGGLAPQALPVQVGVRVRPDTVTVGEPFAIAIRVRAPRGASIAFPAGPDSGLSVEAVDPRSVSTAADTTAVDQTAIYRLAAWDTGAQAARLGGVVVTLSGSDRRIAIGGDQVYVRSVLPRDTALQVPKPARDIVPSRWPWWIWLLAGAALALALGLLFWWWRRRRRRRPAPVADAYEAARREFARIDALRLSEAGEAGRYVALNVEVVRDYLAERAPAAARALTSTELLHALHASALIPVAHLAPVLTEADLIKFARQPVTAARAAQLVTAARGVVEDTERALRAERERAAAAARAA